MAGWNGSGIFSKTYSWVADAANGIKIRADRHDQNDTDFTNGINNCLTKDGQNAATADLPMGTRKHTNVGNAAARNQYSALGQVQDNTGRYFLTTGTANAYTGTLSPAITSYSSGQSFIMIAHATNTGSSTINLNSVGTVNILKNGTAALASGDITAGRAYQIVRTGSGFQLMGSKIETLGTMASQNANNVNISGGAIAGITDLAIADGGTGASTAAAAFAALKQAASDTATGVVELATAAETLTGTDTARVITPAGFSGNKSLATSGYYKLPGGLIIQWGYDTGATGGTGTTSFPTSFASACYTVVAISDGGGARYVTINDATVTTSQFEWISSGAGQTGLRYIAIGV